MKKLKSEMWDKVQYIFRNYYDRMTHAAFYYDGRLDLAMLRNSVKAVVDKVDVLHSSYRPGPFVHRWVVHEDYDVAAAVTKVEAKSGEEAVERCLTTHIDFKDTLQFRVFIVRAEDAVGDTLCFVTNHMCLDGSDLKYYCGKVIECYNVAASGGDVASVEIKSGTRDAEQIYTQMSTEKRKRAEGLYKNVSRTGLNNKFPFTDEEEVVSRIAKVKVSAPVMSAVAGKAKAAGASVNDALLAAFFRSLTDALGLGGDEKINITSMVDLRRHRDDNATEGLTNLTGFMLTTIDGVGVGFEDTLAAVVDKNRGNKADDCLGLYGLPLLKLAFTIFPYFISEIAIRIGYNNPLIGMSNIGRLDAAPFEISGLRLADAFMTGAVKYKPYMQLTATTFGGVTTLCIAERCSDTDYGVMMRFLGSVAHELETYAASR